jgi:hypothetical protein
VSNFVSDRKDKHLRDRLEAARKSVERADAIRRGHLYPQVDFEKKKGTMSKSGVRYIRKDLENATIELRRPVGFRLAVRTANVLQAITLPYITFLIGVSVLRANLPPPWNILTSPYVVLPMFAMAAVFLVLKQYIGRTMKKYVNKRSGEDARDRNLKKITQQAIYDLRRELIVSRQDPSKFKFKVFHKDYEAMEVVSRPGLLKDYYVAKVQVQIIGDLQEES